MKNKFIYIGLIFLAIPPMLYWGNKIGHDVISAANYCVAEHRFISPEEKIRLAIADLIQQETMAIVTPKGRNLYQLERYTSVEHFIAENQNVDKLKHLLVATSYFDFINFLAGAIGTVIPQSGIMRANPLRHDSAHWGIGFSREGSAELILKTTIDIIAIEYNVKLRDVDGVVRQRKIEAWNVFDKCGKTKWRWWDGYSAVRLPVQ